MRRRANSSHRPAELSELLLLICGDEDQLLARYGDLSAARERLRILRARGELDPDQAVTDCLLEEA